MFICLLNLKNLEIISLNFSYNANSVILNLTVVDSGLRNVFFTSQSFIKSIIIRLDHPLFRFEYGSLLHLSNAYHLHFLIREIWSSHGTGEI